MKKTCGITNVQIWDQRGDPHRYKVTKIDVLTEPLKRSRLNNGDKSFLMDNDIQLSLNWNATHVRPEILLGCADVFSLLHGHHLTLPSGLQVIASRLGYLVTGHSERVTRTAHCSLATNDVPQNSTSKKSDELVPHTHQGTPLSQDHLTECWEDFFTFESSGIREFQGAVKEERKRINDAVWKKFEDTIQRHDDGYHVSLPWKENSTSLPDNKAMAFRRLESTLTKLRHSPEILKQYHDTFIYQLSLGIIEEVDESVTPDGNRVHYLAHHAVITPDKETTKLRVVFDASAHRQGEHSLNDVLHKGPVMLPPLNDILLRFRIGNIALVSDVEKAFLQIRLHSADRDATRVLWVRDPYKPPSRSNLVTYRFTRVTFGLNCSPFLLAGTLHHHIKNFITDKGFAQTLEESTYVDNVILTANTTEETLKMYHKVKTIFRDINMNLRQFRSNNDEANSGIATADLSTNPRQKILGILWMTDEDTLTIKCNYPTKQRCTKRTVSEQISSIYDPHGWLTPLTLAGKQFFQQLWEQKYEWDTPLSLENQTRWNEIVDGADGFQHEMPRQAANLGEESTIILFSDATHQCAATCAYIVQSGKSTLLTGKCKLTPLKSRTTVPKMELNALTLATRLANSIYTALKTRIIITAIVLLSDSEIALSWIRNEAAATAAGTMVNNRATEIRKIVETLPVNTYFGYVNTLFNPADCATRGVDKSNFGDHIWWKGPAFITTPLESWPTESHLFRLKVHTDEATCTVSQTQPINHVTDILDWKRHNDIDKCITTVGYVLRIIRIWTRHVNEELRTRVERTTPEIRNTATKPFITTTERKQALNVLLRNHQAVHLTEQQGKTWKELRLRKDNCGILRCRGRMDKADLSFDTKQPILIQPKTPLAEAIVRESHTLLHCGIAHTIANVRKKYWIPKLRQLVRRIVRRCVPCQRMNNLPYRYPHMDDLPECRVRRSKPFQHIGIDYFGPITAKENDVEKKFYEIIFTCTSTRLIHLELVPNMTTEHFLQTLRRFFARRGIPSTIVSDNGPYFMLAEQILRETINETSVAKTLAAKGIEWKTITPYAPWQRAFYERLIKSVKHSLLKVLRGTIPTKENLETLLVEIEGMLNCRPLTYQEARWEEMPILRPIDFIQPEMTVTFPFEGTERELEDAIYLPPEEAVLLRTRSHVEEALRSSHKFTERFWSIWSQQYLTSLREAHKLELSNQRSTNKTPHVGKIVLIADPVLPRNCWKIGRITNLKADNGLVREAEIKTPTGRVIRRPINHLVPMEIEEDNETFDEPTTSTPKAEPRYNLRRRKNGSVEGPEYREYDSLLPQ